MACVCERRRTPSWEGMVAHTPMGLSVWGRQLDEWCAAGIELWAAIEKPDGRVVDCLLDHGVVVYPVNPKAVDRARDRFGISVSKSDTFDGRVLAQFLDHVHSRPCGRLGCRARGGTPHSQSHADRPPTDTDTQSAHEHPEGIYPRVLDLFGI